MANPRALINQLYTHWDLVEWLVRASKELPAFTVEQIIGVLGKLNPSSTDDERGAMLRSLCNNDVLQALPRSSEVQVNPLVLEFVRGLTHEHELGLSAVLQARVEAIRTATALLQEGVASSDIDLLRSSASKLSELFRQISQQLDNDRHAIMELSEQAKSADSSMPMARRYRAVLEAYDQYVEPMNQMMDSGSDGTFYKYLEDAERALDHAVEGLETQGALYSHRLQLRQVAYQSKDLRRLGRAVAQHCADTLLPLREEIRQHNRLSSAISAILGQVRKKGLKRALKQAESSGLRLPVWRVERVRRVTVGDEVLTIMSEARDYQPVTQVFPDDITPLSSDRVELIDELAVLAHLQSSLPVDNLLAWLQQYYPQFSDSSVLRLYHDLSQNEAFCRAQHDQECAVSLSRVKVHHYPHKLSEL